MTREKLDAYLEVIFGILALLLPVLWHETLTRDPLQAGISIVVIGTFIVLQIRRSSKKTMVSDIEFLEQLAAITNAAVQLAYSVDTMVSEGLTEELEESRQEILKGIAVCVSYLNESRFGVDVNACFMRSYQCEGALIHAIPPSILDVVRFTETHRELSTYPFLLNLELWAEVKPELTEALALPVDDPRDENQRFKLLPGAPYAFAMNEPTIINTAKLADDYFTTKGKNLDPVIQREVITYFDNQHFKSFLSIPMKVEDRKVGVLNVHTDVHPVIKKNEERMALKLLQPLVSALAQLMDPVPIKAPAGGP